MRNGLKDWPPNFLKERMLKTLLNRWAHVRVETDHSFEKVSGAVSHLRESLVESIVGVLLFEFSNVGDSLIVGDEAHVVF